MLWSMSQGCTTLTGKDFHRSTGNFPCWSVCPGEAPSSTTPQHPRSPRPSPCRFPSCSLLLPCLWVYPRHLGVWVTPEEEEAARGLITAGEMPLLRARKKVRRARQTVPMASPWQQGLPDMHTGKRARGPGASQPLQPSPKPPLVGLPWDLTPKQLPK